MKLNWFGKPQNCRINLCSYRDPVKPCPSNSALFVEARLVEFTATVKSNPCKKRTVSSDFSGQVDWVQGVYHELIIKHALNNARPTLIRQLGNRR